MTGPTPVSATPPAPGSSNWGAPQNLVDAQQSAAINAIIGAGADPANDTLPEIGATLAAHAAQLATKVSALGSAAVITTATTPVAGMKNRYSAAAGPLAPTLPALSTLAAGPAEYYVEKDGSDTSLNTVTVTCAGSDTFENGTSTTKVLAVPTEWAVLVVVSIGGTKFWAVKSQGLGRTQADARYAPGSQYVQAQKTLTRGDASSIYTASAAPGFTTVGRLASTAVVVDSTDRYQTMLGFGAAITDASAYLLTRSLTQAQRTALLTRLFSPAQGNLSTVRVCIGDSDFRNETQYYSYDDVAAGQTDATLSGFSVLRDQRYIIPVLQEILAINPGVRVIASMWSPPAWMKTPQVAGNPPDMAQGGFNSGYNQQLANYLVAFVTAYATHGIPIYALTGQNEPSAVYVGRPSMLLTNTQIIALMPVLRATLDAAGYTDIKLWPVDSSDLDYAGIAPTVLADPTCGPAIDGTSLHGYSLNAWPNAFVSKRGYPSKSLHLVEMRTLLAQTWSQSLQQTAGVELIGAIRAGVESVTWWNLALDPTGLPTQGSTGRRGVVTVNTDGTGVAMLGDGVTFSNAPDAYVLLHVAPFLRPGARRCRSTSNPNGLSTVAFVNLDGSVVLLAFNNSATAATFQVSDARAGQAFTDTLQPYDLVTYRWGTTATSSPAAAPATIVAPGAPTVTATADHLKINLSVTASATVGSIPVQGFRVWRVDTPASGPAVTTLVATLLPGQGFVDTNVSTSDSYVYYGIAYGLVASAQSANTASVVPLPASAPSVPTGVTATPTYAAVGVSWTTPNNNGSPITGYTVQRVVTPSGGSAGAATTVYTGTATSFVDTTASTQTSSYAYQVKATNAVGDSPYTALSAGASPLAGSGNVTPTGVTLAQSTARVSPTVFYATPSLGDTLAIVVVSHATYDLADSSAVISGVTFGGAAMSLVQKVGNGYAFIGGDRVVSVWKLFNAGGFGSSQLEIDVTFGRDASASQTRLPNVAASVHMFRGSNNGTILNVTQVTSKASSGTVQLQNTSPGTSTADLVFSAGSFRQTAAPTLVGAENVTQVVDQVPAAGSNEQEWVGTQPGSASSQTTTAGGLTPAGYTFVLSTMTIQGGGS